MLDDVDTDDRQISPRQSDCAGDTRFMSAEKANDRPADFAGAKTGGHERH